jgi:hypothetical protein
MRKRSLLILVCAAALGLPAAPAPAAQFVAHLHAPNHHPKAGTKTWRITVTARTASGRALHAKATYKFLFRGRVVSTQYPNPGHVKGGKRPYAFTGRYRDTILWPRRAVGFPLTFRVVVVVPGKGHVNLDWKVLVHR